MLLMFLHNCMCTYLVLLSLECGEKCVEPLLTVVRGLVGQHLLHRLQLLLQTQIVML